MDSTINIDTWLTKARKRLKKQPEESISSLYALLMEALQKPKPWIIAHSDEKLSPNVIQKIDLDLNRVIKGEPLAYILGHWEFFGLDFIISQDVLIPRPETELMVERAIHWMKVHPNYHLAADVGTGSGCIAISIAKYIHDLNIIASDISFSALRVAHKNIKHHNMKSRISLLCANTLQPLNSKFGLICANLPYIPSENLKSLEVRKYEPMQALDGGKDGMRIIHGLLKNVSHYLQNDGLLLLEIESNQGKKALRCSKSIFPFAKINILKDLAGRDRLLLIENTKL